MTINAWKVVFVWSELALVLTVIWSFIFVVLCKSAGEKAKAMKWQRVTVVLSLVTVFLYLGRPLILYWMFK